MNKIDFPRSGIDGINRTKVEIEDAFINKIEKGIGKRLKKELEKKTHTAEKLCAIEFIQSKLRSVLKAPPKELDALKNEIDQKYGKLFYKSNNEATEFGNIILECFNYKQYRTTHLVEHAKRLNVKCCPYCNQHYTLNVRTGKKSGLALFQFDHFFSKAKYPYLSMSMYNLIPVCSTCNHNKLEKALPLVFNPYYKEIADLFRFEVAGALHKLYLGDLKQDYIEDVVIKPQKDITQKDLDDYDSVLQIKTQYEWHKDVAFEAFCRAYVNDKNLIYTYYKLIKDNPALLSRVIHGTYMEQKDIEKRPLSKFYQDIYYQAID